MTSFVQKQCEKDVFKIATLILYLIGLPPPITLLLILQWHTEVCEEMFDVKSRQKVDSTRNCKPRQLCRRFQTLIWRPGEMVQNRESLPDYPRPVVAS